MDMEKTIREFLAKLCVALDSSDYKTYLKSCLPEFNYRIAVYSPEIRRDMVWLEKDKEGLSALIDLLPKQNMDRTPLTRHFSLCTVADGEREGEHDVRSTLQIFRTEHDGGETSLVAVGEYRDKIRVADQEPLLLQREVRLHTRMLGKGYHVPF